MLLYRTKYNALNFQNEVVSVALARNQSSEILTPDPDVEHKDIALDGNCQALGLTTIARGADLVRYAAV